MTQKGVILALLILSVLSPNLRANELNQLQWIQASEALKTLAKPRQSWDQIATAMSVDGVDYQADIEQANTALERSGFYLKASPDWITSRGQQLKDNPRLILTSSLEEIRTLLGALSRQERFVSGIIGRAILTDVYLYADQRVQQLH